MPNKIKVINFRIASGLSGLRLDKALAKQPDIMTRSRAAKLIQSGCVFLNGKTTKASLQTTMGQTFEIHLPVEQELELTPYDFPLDIYYEDSDLIVLNKPSGLVVHPASGHKDDTLVNALVHYGGKLSMGFGENRPGIVHRLDKDTSGLIVVAKNDKTQSHLCDQFRNKTVHRKYFAVVFGEPKESSGTIRSYLKRHPTDRKKYASEKTKGDPTGKLAITHFKKIKTSPSGITLLECQLETGRTHQIRVHMSESSHPIIGDEIYGGKTRAKNLKSIQLRKWIKDMNRIGLHAAELGFIHPQTNELLNFSSTWPANMSEIIMELGFNDLD